MFRKSLRAACKGSKSRSLATPGSFNAHASHYSALYFFGYNSPADIARQLFKPSTDAASLLVSI